MTLSADLGEYADRYRDMEEPGVEIVVGGEQIALRLPGVPPEFDAALAADEDAGPAASEAEHHTRGLSMLE